MSKEIALFILQTITPLILMAAIVVLVLANRRLKAALVDVQKTAASITKSSNDVTANFIELQRKITKLEADNRGLKNRTRNRLSRQEAEAKQVVNTKTPSLESMAVLVLTIQSALEQEDQVSLFRFRHQRGILVKSKECSMLVLNGYSNVWTGPGQALDYRSEIKVRKSNIGYTGSFRKFNFTSGVAKPSIAEMLQMANVDNY